MAARGSAKPQPAVARNAHSAGGGLRLAQGLGCGLAVAFAPPTALLATVLLAPGVLALVLDYSTGQAEARAVLLCGLAAAVQPLLVLWRTGHLLPTALGMIGDLDVVGPAWAAAAGGWLLVQLAPLAVQLVLDTASRRRAAALRARRQALATEWGLDPSA